MPPAVVLRQMVGRTGRDEANRLAWLNDIHHLGSAVRQSVHHVRPPGAAEHANTHQVILAERAEGAELSGSLFPEQVEVDPVGQSWLIALELSRRLVELMQC